MLTVAKMQKILFEKDPDKKQQMIDELPEKDKKKLLAESEKLAKEGRNLIEKWRQT